VRKQKSETVNEKRNAKHQEGKFCFGHAVCVTLIGDCMQLEDFLKNQSYFSLGHLPTEQVHPATRDLSNLVKTDLTRAIGLVQKIDLETIAVVEKSLPLIHKLSEAIQSTFKNGHRVFLSGCGATGRLALTLEMLYRKLNANSARENQVQALMAGGDFALVKSVENFEDHPEYGVRHLADLGFKDGDLLIAITEGGETPYVIGTVEGALAASSRDVWFVYCNPKEVLLKTVERSRIVIENPRVRSLCLETGPMALSGSTRLQAATAQMLAVGAALFQNFQSIAKLKKAYGAIDLSSFLSEAIVWEAKQYSENKVVLYETSDYPIAVLTDTTERAPTFSLASFEKTKTADGVVSLCYLGIPKAHDSKSAWHEILGREPIGLSWPELNRRLALNSILEFDFGKSTKLTRAARVAPREQAVLRIYHEKDALLIDGKIFCAKLSTVALEDPLCEQLLIKMILNTLSLMVMGKVDRYEGNVMTWVRASNGKLIDRTLRYLEFLIEKRKLKPVTRADLIELVFSLKDKIGPNDALILKVLETLSQN
jgi:N-acetylmuramic acid 6-phosphate etherase